MVLELIVCIATTVLELSEPRVIEEPGDIVWLDTIKFEDDPGTRVTPPTTIVVLEFELPPVIVVDDPGVAVTDT
jgi:hypothetical protein